MDEEGKDGASFLLVFSEGSDGVIPPPPVRFTDSGGNFFTDESGNFFKEG